MILTKECKVSISDPKIQDDGFDEKPPAIPESAASSAPEWSEHGGHEVGQRSRGEELPKFLLAISGVFDGREFHTVRLIKPTTLRQ